MNQDERPIEIRLAEFQFRLKQLIGTCGLNVSLIELVLSNLYNEVKQLADENLNQKFKEMEEAKKQGKEETDGNTNEAG